MLVIDVTGAPRVSTVPLNRENAFSTKTCLLLMGLPTEHFSDVTPVFALQLTPVRLTSDLLLSASLVSVLLLVVVVLTSVGLAASLGRRASRGTYSPSRQEKEGSRVEMWSVTQTPPTERLI